MSNNQAIGYAYDSLGNPMSLEKQRQKIEQFCQENGLELQETYECENVKGQRKFDNFRAFLETQRENGITVVIAQIDRITDEFDDIVKLKGVLRDSDVKVISTKEDDMEYLELTLGGAVVQSKNTVQKPNRIPYGYEMIDGQLVPKVGEADVVVWIFEKRVQYADNPPELLVECVREYLKGTYSKRDYAKLTEEDIREQATAWVTAYITTELNVRLGAYSKNGMIKDGSKVKECLKATLTEQEEQLMKSEVQKSMVFRGQERYPQNDVYVGKLR